MTNKIKKEINKLKELNQRISYLIKNSMVFFMDLNVYNRNYYKTVRRIIEDCRELYRLKEDDLFQSKIDLLEQVGERASQCGESMCDVIIAFQYEEMVRQKLEHIQEINRQLIFELEHYYSITDKNNLEIVEEIKVLNVNQIELISEEINTAICEVKDSLNDIDNFSSSIKKCCEVLNLFFLDKGQSSVSVKHVTSSVSVKHVTSMVHLIIEMIDSMKFDIQQAIKLCNETDYYFREVDKVKKLIESIQIDFLEKNPLNEGSREERLMAIYKNYVMDSERVVFKNLFGNIIEVNIEEQEGDVLF